MTSTGNKVFLSLFQKAHIQFPTQEDLFPKWLLHIHKSFFPLGRLTLNGESGEREQAEEDRD